MDLKRGQTASSGLRLVVILLIAFGLEPSRVEAAPQRPGNSAAAVRILPDSARLKIMACLANADLDCAVAAYLAAKGGDEAPAWLQAFVGAFNAVNRVAGRCEPVARAIYDGFVRFGQRPQVINIASDRGRLFMTWQSRIMVSDNNFHQAVRLGDMIYDAFTGPQGMAVAQYFSDQALQVAGKPVITVVTGQ